MNALTKVLVVLVFLLSVAFATTQMVLYGKREDFGAKYVDVYERLQSATADNARLKGELADKTTELETALAQLDSERTALQSDLADAKEQVEELKLDGARLLASVQSLTEANNGQQDLLVAADAKSTQLNEIISQRDQEIEGNQGTIAELNKMVAARDATVGDLEYQLTDLTKRHVALTELKDRLQKTVTMFQDMGFAVPPAQVPPISGRVIAVDDELGNAVIDKGEMAQVKPATRFTIHRGSDYIARLVIHDVQGQVALGRVMLLAEGKEVRVGDSVTTEVR